MPLLKKWSPWFVILAVTALFSIVHINHTPFTSFAPLHNYETYTTYSSYVLFANEPWTFPLGKIHSLTYPFADANIGNTGCIPLAAIFFKFFGTFVPALKSFYYFPLVEILSVFLSSYFLLRIFQILGRFSPLEQFCFLVLALLSPSLLIRVQWQQTFVIASFAIFSAWTFFSLKLKSNPGQLGWISFALLFPVAAMTDYYAFVGICMATAATLLLSFSFRQFVTLAAGLCLSLVSLFTIGMFPLPKPSHSFSAFEFGMGGGYHVADLFGFFIPPKLAFLQPGQYEGTIYVGLGTLAAFAILLFTRRCKPLEKLFLIRLKPIVFAAILIFIFSLGYVIHVLGHPLHWIGITPAAMLAEIFHPLYNIRAPGRLGIFPLLIFTLCAFWLLCLRLENNSRRKIILVGLLALQLVASLTYLKPLPAENTKLVYSRFSPEEATLIKSISKGKSALILAPSPHDDTYWLEFAFSLTVISKLKSNIYYIARSVDDHETKTLSDQFLIQKGNLKAIFKKYPNSLIAFPKSFVRNTLLDSHSELKRQDLSEVTLLWQ